jgi:APA family basic amino acid/polyamine antiporter
MAEAAAVAQTKTHGFVRGLGLLDSTMIVAGSMIGSGIFIVSGGISKQVGSPGWLLVVWIVTGLLTVVGALSYGELAAMMPKAGGQYVYLREAFSPMWGFLYGWTLFLVIQTGTIAAVAVGFARYLGVLVPSIGEERYLIRPINLFGNYAISLSTAQLVGVLLIVLLTFMNTRGLKLGKFVQNTFTTTKLAALFGLIVLGVGFGLIWHSDVARANFGNLWTVRGSLEDLGGGLTAAAGLGLFVGVCVAQTGSLFSADAWNNITFTAAEVKDPKRNIPLSLAFGTGIVIALYLLANVAYLTTLPFEKIQGADRVATESMNVIFSGRGAIVMAVFIMISTFGCNNGLILAGARAYYAMARDGLFFKSSGQLNDKHVPAWGLVIQGIWAALLVLPRTIKHDAAGHITGYGNLYGNLLDYVISAALIFYILTIAGIIVLRFKRPNAERPYKAFGYPVVPILYIIGATVILTVLFIYQTATTWPGLIIVITGIPVYFLWSKLGTPMADEGSISEAAAKAQGEY